MTKYITVAELGEILGYTGTTIHGLIDDGKIPHINLTDTKRGRRVPVSYLESLQDNEIEEDDECHYTSETDNGKSVLPATGPSIVDLFQKQRARQTQPRQTHSDTTTG